MPTSPDKTPQTENLPLIANIVLFQPYGNPDAAMPEMGNLQRYRAHAIRDFLTGSRDAHVEDIYYQRSIIEEALDFNFGHNRGGSVKPINSFEELQEKIDTDKEVNTIVIDFGHHEPDILGKDFTNFMNTMATQSAYDHIKIIMIMRSGALGNYYPQVWRISNFVWTSDNYNDMYHALRDAVINAHQPKRKKFLGLF